MTFQSDVNRDEFMSRWLRTADDYASGSHLPVLHALLAFLNPRDLCVESGGGVFSTHYLLSQQQRLLTIEADRAWRAQLLRWYGDFPLWTLGSSRLGCPRSSFQLLLIDGLESTRRDDLAALYRRAEFLVLHDWESAGKLGYHQVPFQATHPYTYTFVPANTTFPHTLLASRRQLEESFFFQKDHPYPNILSGVWRV